MPYHCRPEALTGEIREGLCCSHSPRLVGLARATAVHRDHARATALGEHQDLRGGGGAEHSKDVVGVPEVAPLSARDQAWTWARVRRATSCPTSASAGPTSRT